MPGLATLINFCLTDLLYYRRLVTLYYTVLVVFLVSNYRGVKSSGVEEAYPFLKWQDPTETALFIGGIMILILLVVYA